MDSEKEEVRRLTKALWSLLWAFAGALLVLASGLSLWIATTSDPAEVSCATTLPTRVSYTLTDCTPALERVLIETEPGHYLASALLVPLHDANGHLATAYRTEDLRLLDYVDLDQPTPEAQQLADELLARDRHVVYLEPPVLRRRRLPDATVASLLSVSRSELHLTTDDPGAVEAWWELVGGAFALALLCALAGLGVMAYERRRVRRTNEKAERQAKLAARMSLGAELAEQGRHQEATQRFAEAFEVAKLISEWGVATAEAAVALGEQRLRSGDAKAARSDLEHGLHLILNSPSSPEVRALRERAEVALRRVNEEA